MVSTQKRRSIEGELDRDRMEKTKKRKQEGRKLSALLKKSGAKLKRGSADPRVKRLVIDSRRVTPGSLFFALPGLRKDGNAFVDEALNRGAIGVVSNSPRKFGLSKAVFAQSDDPRLTLAKVARRFFRKPDKDLDLVGITGTNGKTTVAHLAKNFLSVDGAKTGCLGTVGYDLVERVLPSFRTTPEAHELCELLSQMRDFGCERALMEVSSHGVDQLRVAELRFKVGVFLNLTRDHLDYHGDMESYFAVKRKFINGEIGPPPKRLAINVDDEYGRRLASESREESVLTFGLSDDAALKATDVELAPNHSLFTLEYEGKRYLTRSPLIGKYNISNTLAALSTAILLGLDIEKCIASLETFKGIPGRMERVDQGQAFEVVVDYAHTGNALENALRMLKEITPGELKVVFGCGGDRDRGKRPQMAEIAARLADRVVVTSDNPRTEDPQQILDDVVAGIPAGSDLLVEGDRAQAIASAIAEAEPNDLVLVAGKGHE
ncbi:MAG TPA: UDP-N-acetylmuramoyl-L-alanyl-D-glutamate--2,6-diaminopimelate ligase, partial [Opitutae bacterium]|nr:UDP-N-acetylmuramoyl-L-alanyl-D-glutamate--2,6-diaminopimelate ligase [Opitutae bacterium]